LEFRVHNNDINTLARIYDYFQKKDAEIYHLKEVDPSKVLENYVILSRRPFKAISRREMSRSSGTPRGRRRGSSPHDIGDMSQDLGTIRPDNGDGLRGSLKEMSEVPGHLEGVA
jgi:hypothetical protein